MRCEKQVAIERADVVGTGYRCDRCSLRVSAEGTDVDHGPSIYDDGEEREDPRALMLVGAPTLVVGIVLLSWSPLGTVLALMGGIMLISGFALPRRD